jgi:hypothetical protein
MGRQPHGNFTPSTMSKKKQPRKLSPGAEKLREYLLQIYNPIVWPADLK